MKDLHTELPYETAKKLRAAGMPIQFIWQDEGPRLCCNATWADAAEWLACQGIEVLCTVKLNYTKFAQIDVGIFRRIILRKNETEFQFLSKVIDAAIEILENGKS